MLEDFQENKLELLKTLNLDPITATTIMRAYNIDQIKVDFLHNRYSPSRDGDVPVIAFARQVLGEEEYNNECNYLLRLTDEIKIPKRMKKMIA